MMFYDDSDSNWVDMGGDDDDGDDDVEISHGGGEREDRAKAIFESITMPSYIVSIFYFLSHYLPVMRRRVTRRRIYVEARRTRLRSLHASWDAQMPCLVQAFLAWKYGHSGEASDSLPMDTQAEGGSIFHVTAIGITSRQRMLAIHQNENELANVSLLREGLLGCSPETPSVAFALQTLELYHRLRRRHGQLSVQTMAHVLCDLHDYTYHSCHREQLDIAFDAYLDILRHVEKMVNIELGRDSLHWRARNACPPCHYELEDEPVLVPRAWYAQDGNYSLKRAANAGHVDQHHFASTYNLSRAEVDVFKDEVRCKPPVDGDLHDVPSDGLGGPGDVTDGQDVQTTCAKNWKAANSANKKSAFEIYETNGIFPVACRHGLIVTFAEMVHSNELAKYPLATTNFLLEVFGYDIGLGADIGCLFTETIKNSNLLKDKAAQLRLQVVVNAFHGWAHNRLCQLQYHPLYRKGSFMFNNYKQALMIIKDYTPQIAAFKAQFLVTDADIEQWINQELLAVSYVEALMLLQSADAKWTQASNAFATTSFDVTNYGANSRITARLKADRRAAMDQHLVAIRAVTDLEAKLGLIGARWTHEHPDFIATLEYMRQREYHRALDKIQQLVVQQLFELSKANLSGLGYKLRESIWRALKVRSKAIQSTLDRYNAVAPLMRPPAPTLEWKQIMDYVFVLRVHLWNRFIPWVPAKSA
ncbi:hypothetical protein HWV62_4415, partial [Athelia sp. TMB]